MEFIKKINRYLRNDVKDCKIYKYISIINLKRHLYHFN